jgi:hypothetical protein
MADPEQPHETQAGPPEGFERMSLGGDYACLTCGCQVGPDKHLLDRHLAWHAKVG